LSQLDPPPASIGTSDQFVVPERWKDFVKVVLDITVQAYQDMSRKVKAQRGWKEDTFTINLVNLMRPIGRRHPMYLTVVPQFYVYTPEMETGEAPPEEASKIDIHLSGSWENYDIIYFAWECKLIVDRQKDEQRGYLVSEYITHGLLRFIDGKYSNDVDDAGMIGYVLIGDAANIVNNINESMQAPQRHRKLSDSNYLKNANPIGDFEDVYQSYHSRIRCDKPIQLYHLFMKFDFE
jgi:hypothetical protein